MTSRILTIVFTDIKGFTERTANMNRDDILKLLAKQDELLKPVIAQYGGTVIKSIGDAYLVTYESPTNAVICGLIMQHTLKRYNATVWPEFRIEIRVAINTGEVNIVDKDVIGDPVNVASRVEGVTEANEVWFTEATYLAMNKQEVPTSKVGEFRLKGIAEAVRLYRVVQDENLELYRKLVTTQPIATAEVRDQLAAASPAGLRPRRSPALAAAIAVLLVLGAAGAFLVFKPGREADAIRKLIDSGQYAEAIDTAQKLLEKDPANAELKELSKKAADLKLKKEIDLVVNQIDAGQYPEALFAAGKFLEKDPANPELQGLIRKAVDADVRVVIARKEVEAAEKSIEEYGKRYLFLGRLDHLEKEVYVIRIEQAWKKDYHKAMVIVEEMVQKYGSDPEVIHEALKFYSKCGIDVRYTFKYAQQLATMAPEKYKDSEIVINALKMFLEWYGPGEGWDDTREFVSKNYYDKLKPMLKESIYDGEKADVRWNAKFILEMHKEPVDLLRFYLAHLLDEKDRSNNVRMEETLTYFLQRVYEGPKADVIAKLPRPLLKFPMLDNRVYDLDQPVMKIVTGLFMDSLRSFLTDALSDRKEECRRINAFHLLQAKGLSNDQLMTYHTINVLDWNRRNRTPWTLESIQYFETLPDGLKPDRDVADGLKRLADLAAKEVDRWKKQGDFDEANAWLPFAEGAKRALDHLKPEH